MTLPVFELDALDGPTVIAALADHGALFVRDSDVGADRFQAALADEREFFELPGAVRAALGIEWSAHFRGYSVMQNERDHREQMHFGRDQQPVSAGEPFWRLQGPNLWPPDERWCARVAEWFDVTEQVGRRVLHHIATTLHETEGSWLGAAPYRVAKMIAYHPQAPGGEQRSGVAAHLDFSLLTLTVQDEVGGLQVQGSDGVWRHVEPVAGAWLVHAGELLQYVSGNRVRATPHRVVNPSVQRTRYSMPYFLCPSLDTTLRPAADAEPLSAPASAPASRPGVMPLEHIHAVLDPERQPNSIAYGPAEGRRKGENLWCRICCREPGA